MTQSLFVAWLVAAGVLVVAELLTLTFYLLIFGVCALAAAAAALFGFALIPTLVVFSVLSACSVFGKLPQRLGKRLAQTPAVLASDIGATVTVTEVADGGAFRVQYRGAQWPAAVADEPSAVVTVGQELRVVRVEGIRLVCKQKT